MNILNLHKNIVIIIFNITTIKICQCFALNWLKIGTGSEHGELIGNRSWGFLFSMHSIIGFLMDWIEYIIMRIEGYEPKCKVIYNTHICRNWCKRIRKWIEITFVQIKKKYHFNFFGIYIAGLINVGPAIG